MIRIFFLRGESSLKYLSCHIILSVAQLELVFDEGVVDATEGDQRGMGAGLGHMPLVEDDYTVGVTDGRETVGHDHHRASAVELRQVLHNRPLVPGIQGVGRLVEEDEVRVAVDRPRYEYALPLSLAQANPVAPDLRVVLQRQRLDVVADARYARRLAHPPVVNVAVVHGDVARYRLREDHAVLHHHAAPPAPPPDAVVVKRAPGHRYLPPLHRIIAEHELQQRRLAAPRGPDHRRDLPRRYGERYVLQRHARRVAVVAETDPGKHDGALPAVFRDAPAVFLLLPALVHLVDALQRYADVLQGVDEGHQLLHGGGELAHDILYGEHSAQRYLSVDDGGGGKHRDKDVLYLVDENAPRLLVLLEPERLHLHSVEVGLRLFPLLAAPPLAVLELYLLHGGHELVCAVLVEGLTLEELVVYHLASAQERRYPQPVGRASGEEDQEHRRVVYKQHDAEDDEG